MRFLSADDLSRLLPPAAVIAAVEDAVRAHAAGKATVPARQHLEWNANTLLTMPAVAGDAVGIKLVTVVPANSARGLPVTNGLMVLNDAETGVPLAILNGATVTAQRTGAVGAVGAKYMTPANLTSVGIIGVGVQGVWQAIFACTVRPIETVYFVARSDKSAKRFREAFSARIGKVAIIRCHDARELLTRTQLIITATTSSEPVLPDDAALLKHKHFISVGSFKPSMQELPTSVFRLAGHIVIDCSAARHEAGDVARPLSEGVLKEEDVYHIAELVMGKRSIDPNRTTAFKCVGFALYDLFVAQAMLDAANQLSVGHEIAL